MIDHELGVAPKARVPMKLAPITQETAVVIMGIDFANFSREGSAMIFLGTKIVPFRYDNLTSNLLSRNIFFPKVIFI